MAIGWSREDLEGPQALDSTPGHMLHPTHHEFQQSPATSGTGSQNTVFQDGPPPPWRPVEKDATPAKGVAVQNVSEEVDLPPHSKPARTIFGLRKTTFFLVISNILFAIALVVVAVVLSRGSSNTCAVQGDGSSAAAGGSSPSPTDDQEAGKVCFATDNNTPGIRNMVAGEVESECPLPEEGSATYYTVPNTDLRFRRVCGYDIYGDDMGWFPVVSMRDCIAICAWLNLYPASAMGPCRGVAWAYGDGAQGKGIAFCYPKSGEVKESNPRNGTEVAILVDS